MEEFKAEYKEIDGKRVLIIKARSEEIIHPDGRKDVIIHAPSLSLISSFIKSQKEE